MNIKAKRQAAIRDTISKTKMLFRDGVTVPALEDAKVALMALCAKSDLFPRSDFPIPGGDEIDRTFLIHQDQDGGYALYVNSSLPGQTSRPHDHGGSWALIAAIEGAETHLLYVSDATDDSSEAASLRQVSEIVVQPGIAVSMMPDGIHSIDATAAEPLLHLHLYGRGFPWQTERKEFDLETGRIRHFMLEDIGFIEDAR